MKSSTKRELGAKIFKIMDECESPTQLPDQIGYIDGKVWAVNQLLHLFTEEMEGIINTGDDSKSTDWIQMARAELRHIQRKRLHELVKG